MSSEAPSCARVVTGGDLHHTASATKSMMSYNILYNSLALQKKINFQAIHTNLVPRTSALNFNSCRKVVREMSTVTEMATISIPQFWNISHTSFQKTIKVVDKRNAPSVSFPLVLEPSSLSHALPDVLEEVKQLATKPSDESHHSSIRNLLDENGGAVYFKSLPLRSAQDFSRFLDALAGEGQQAWVPYDPLAMNVLRRVQAKNVLTVNEYEIPPPPLSIPLGFSG